MPTETVALVLAGRHVSITVVRSARRKRTLTVSVDPVRGVRVLVPARTPGRDIEALVARQASWIERRLHQVPRAAEVAPIPDRLTYLGHTVPVVVREGQPPKLVLEDGRFALQLSRDAGAAAAGSVMDHFYGTETFRLVTDAVARFAPLVGRQPSRVLVRVQKRRWGSCAADGSLRFNLRLAMLAPEVIDYVVVHELCHLIRRDHSPAFWAEVARVLPDHRDLRARLRKAERELPTW